MKQTEKLDSLIKKIIKEELEERKTIYPSKTGSIGGIVDTKDREQAKTDLRTGKSVQLVKPEEIPSLKEKESEEEKIADTEIMENEVKASDLAGQVSEMIDKLKTMSEGGDDVKKQKLAVKAMKQMESAKAALHTLAAHEVMLEEKQQAEEEKEAEKHVGKFKKALTKLVKEPAAVEKISAKMDAKKMAELKKKIKSGELDEEKLAKVMLQHSLKEGWIK